MAPDPLQTDPDKYHVVFENERVRALEYTDQPGDKTTLHSHPDFVLYAAGPFKRRLHLPDGGYKDRQFNGGEVLFSKAESHVGENVGTTPTHVIMVELKEPRP